MLGSRTRTALHVAAWVLPVVLLPWLFGVEPPLLIVGAGVLVGLPANLVLWWDNLRREGLL